MNDAPIYAVEISVSLYDVMQSRDGKEAISENVSTKLDNVLYSIGFDIKYGYAFTESVSHRPKTMQNNGTWMGPMIVGIERSDKEWLASGYASDEAVICYTKDPHLRATLKTMSAISNNTAETIAELEYMTKLLGGEKK